MKRVRFHPDAEAELIAAGQFYETQTPRLGLRRSVERPKFMRCLLFMDRSAGPATLPTRSRTRSSAVLRLGGRRLEGAALDLVVFRLRAIGMVILHAR
ncbi:MAG: hypothetical protein DME13_00505 [Candidatus Rokuibacteriota bacterium]|nr:MAG: hypothetical protein DME13_00505 [Candidatus Rokubacteria bacterium]